MYRTIDAAFWTDPKIRELSPEGRFLFLYLITNPHTHVSGIYYLPRSVIAHETGLPLKQVNTLCDTLSKLGFCAFDQVREVVWVRKMMSYQGKGDKNIKSAVHHLLEDLHKSPLIAEFLEQYPEVRAQIPDRVSIPYPSQEFLRTPHSPFPIPDSLSPILIPDQEQELPTAEKRVGARDLAADIFTEKHQQYTGTAYISKTADFVQLAALRKANKIEKRGTPGMWGEAVENYFGSSLRAWTLADLCTRFPVFRNSKVDQYQKPINHEGNGNGHRKTKDELNAETAKRVLSRLDSQNSGGISNDIDGSGSDYLFRKTSKTHL